MLFLGSPPQVRGKPEEIDNAKWHTGITPAGAGKTKGEKAGDSKPMDHPRRCGENSTNCPQSSKHKGSPPQVRGKQTYSAVQSVSPGITPAGAGKTL